MCGRMEGVRAAEAAVHLQTIRGVRAALSKVFVVYPFVQPFL